MRKLALKKGPQTIPEEPKKEKPMPKKGVKMVSKEDAEGSVRHLWININRRW